MLETTKGTVWFGREMMMTNSCKKGRKMTSSCKKGGEMTNSCKNLHLVAEERNEPLDPVVELVVAEGHCVKVEKAVEPALHNIQLSVTFSWSVAFLHTIVVICDCCNTMSSSE